MSLALPRLGGLARGTLAVFGWNLARLGTQLAWVVLMARTLGVDGYGTFSGVAGLALALSGLVGAGLSMRLYRDVARDASLLGLRWSQAIRMITTTGLLVAISFLGAGAYVFPDVPVSALAYVAAAELLATPIAVHVAFTYSATGRLGEGAAVPVFMSASRVLAVLLLPMAVDDVNVESYALVHCISTAAAACLIWCRSRWLINPPKASWVLEKGAIFDGIKLSAIWASSLAFSSLDKASVLRLGGGAAAGEFTAASRFSSLLALPVDAMATAAMPRLFQAGAGMRLDRRWLRMLLLAGFGYGFLAGALLWMCAGLLPSIIGQEFYAAVSVLEVLCFYVPANCMRVVIANVLLGFGRINSRLIVEGAAMVLMLLLIAVMVPSGGAVGAAWAVTATEWLMVVGLVLCMPRGPVAVDAIRASSPSGKTKS